LQADEFSGGPVDVFSSNDPLPPGPLPYADITNPQSLNKYAYTYNNPVKYTDPDGHCPWCVVIFEVASTGYDVYDTLTTLTDPQSTNLEKGLTVLGLGVGIALPGGGYGKAAKEAVETLSEKGAKEGAEALAKKEGGRLGSAETRALDAKVAEDLEAEGMTVTHGGGKPQEYIPGPEGGRRGSSYPDVTATDGKKTVRVNTVDTNKNGSLTSREQRQAQKVQTARPDDEFRTVPKRK
jgi:hypothetical protein